MRIVRQYRVRPTQHQLVTMKEWIGALRWQCNYRLAEGFKWWKQNRSKIGGDDTSSCAIAPLKNSPNYYIQKRHFKKTNELFPFYKNIFFHWLQNCVEQVAIPRYNRKAQKQIERLQPQLYRHQGSKHQVKIQQLELAPVKLASQRQNFRSQTAKWLLKQLMVVDKDLNTKKLAPSKLTFVTGAVEEQFLSIVAIATAVESNLPFGCLNAAGENCLSAINQKDFGGDPVFKPQADRWYFCPNCGQDLEGDESAVRNMEKKAVGILSGGRIGREKKAPVEGASLFWKNARRLKDTVGQFPKGQTLPRNREGIAGSPFRKPKFFPLLYRGDWGMGLSDANSILKSRLSRLSLLLRALGKPGSAGLDARASRQKSLWVCMQNWDAALVETKNPKITRQLQQGDMSPKIGLSRPLSNFV
ncbi:helix-turn-helix domain-containing protein [Funiculus sociatus GB2-A5]|uniref:Helix-turn-helix domain-containing protein n=1 Tax=Funiculus sociatus GB2-A5 TaxID=2933946 RepID=A0ABV0JLD5_9CYAN|nr:MULTISPECIES: helix-turn-helix domain-containing protein [unclassified Trichocoleus]MBD1908680.1 helix-turn-helix domain-containing protein [Trichocoleus sp. FACHB-832]MBD2063302.1 helix-turn-helix domain-containing protein [Trichocoleus sp. FACHB-6]